jgi:predicted ABC-type ATPase
MPKDKRLRVFAGPNGSGKSTLFNEFKTQYNPGYFINADELEKLLLEYGIAN